MNIPEAQALALCTRGFIRTLTDAGRRRALLGLCSLLLQKQCLDVAAPPQRCLLPKGVGSQALCLRALYLFSPNSKRVAPFHRGIPERQRVSPPSTARPPSLCSACSLVQAMHTRQTPNVTVLSTQSHTGAQEPT